MILDLARPSNVLAIHRLRHQPLHAAMNDSVDVRYGVARASQAKNVLLMPPALGKVRGVGLDCEIIDLIVSNVSKGNADRSIAVGAMALTLFTP